jgi:heme exporter protein A
VSAAAPADFDRVEVADVSRLYGRRRALSHVTCTFRAGEIVGLFGPNGAGKSTLLGVLSTLIRPTGGEVRYGDRRARDLGDALRARVGVLGHDLFLYGDLTARENLTFFGRLHGVASIDERVSEALDAARLRDRANDRVSSFSRGLRQRLALERALVHNPRLVLLDEPFTGLDDESSALLVSRLAALRARGAVVVMATHDFESADGVIDRAICLSQGRALPMAVSGGSLRDRYRAAIAGGAPA